MNKIMTLFHFKLISQEIKLLKKFFLSWMAVIIALFLLYASFYPTLKNQIDNFSQILSNLPDEVLIIYGGREMIDHLNSFPGYYSLVSQTLFLAAAIFACALGMILINKEFKDKTIEFIATKPLKKSTLITSKIVSGFIILIFFNFCYCLISIAIGAIFSNDLLSVLLISLSLMIIQLLFYVSGFLLATIFKKLFAPIPLSLGIVFFSLFIGSIFGKYLLIRVIAFFQYFPKTLILEDKQLDWPYLLLSFLIIIIFPLLSYFIYNKKDLT